MWETIIVFAIVGTVAFLFVRSLYRKSIESGQGNCGSGCCNSTCPYSGACDPTNEPEAPPTTTAPKKD